jgi:hypothetical protein
MTMLSSAEASSCPPNARRPPPRPAMASPFSLVESFGPILQEPIWHQQRELEASSVEARIKLAYDRARSLIRAVGKRKPQNPLAIAAEPEKC